MPDPTSLLPLKPIDLQLLLALSVEELHGYGLVLEIERATDGLVSLDPGNLYRVIKRLISDELIAESERRRAADVGDERRRYYRLTALGTRVLGAELQRLRALTNTAAARAAMRAWSA